MWRSEYHGIGHDRGGCWYRPSRQVQVYRLGESPESCGRGRPFAEQSAGTTAVCNLDAVRYLSGPLASDWPLCRWTRTTSASTSEPFRARRIVLLEKNQNTIMIPSGFLQVVWDSFPFSEIFRELFEILWDFPKSQICSHQSQGLMWIGIDTDTLECVPR